MEGTPLFKTLNFPTVCAGCRLSWTLKNAPPPLPGTKPLLIGPLFGSAIAVAPRTEPENISLFFENYKANKLQKFFLWTSFAVSPLLPRHRGMPSFLFRQPICQQMTTATYQQIFLCPPAKNMTTNCSKLRQPDLLDNTGKNTIVDNPS